MFEALRPFQIEALEVLRGTELSSLIIMPTGSGKTRLMYSFKEPGKCSIVCAPYKYLVQQLLHVLKDKGKAFEFPFDHEDGSTFGILASADFIIMPFEMVPTAADLLSSLRGISRLGPMWIDEVSNEENAFVVCHILVMINCRNNFNRG